MKIPSRETYRIRIGIHDPVHRLGVRSQIGRRDVVGRSNIGGECVGESSGQTHMFGGRQIVRIDLYTSLGPSEGKGDQSTFEGHHRGQRGDLVHGDLGVVPDSPLVRAQNIVVLNSISPEEFQFSVVAADRKVDLDHVFRFGEDFTNLLSEVHDLGRHRVPFLRDLIETFLSFFCHLFLKGEFI